MRQILFLALVLSTSIDAKVTKRPPHVDAIYGTDDRSFVSTYSPKNILAIKGSVAMIVPNDLTKKGLLNTYINAPSLKENMNLCKGERHESEPSLSGCTGFLIGEDLMATAGHCVDESTNGCKDITIAFDVYATEKDPVGYKISSKNIYHCKEVVAQEFNGERDFALIRLDRKVKKRTPLKISKASLREGASVFMVGHPLGLPMIWSKSGQVNADINEYSFKATLDSFGGNSGSPVFNSTTNEVEGILVRGEQDFVKDEQKGCYVYMKFDAESEPLRGEGVSKISELLQYLK